MYYNIICFENQAMFAQVKATVTTGLLRISFWVHRNRNEKALKPLRIKAFYMTMGYKKDIFAVFAYEFELSHCYLSLSGIYRGGSSRPPGVQPSSDSVIFFLASFSFDCALASEIKSSIFLYCFNTIPSSEAKVSR